MSEFGQQGLSVSLFKPSMVGGAGVVTTYVPEAEHIRTLTNEVASYGHELSAVGGYESAQFSIVCDRAELEYWAQIGLNLHVVVRDESAMTVWEGFVNQIGIDAGNMSVIRGPLLDVGNYVKVYFNEIVPGTLPPTSLMRRVTGPASRQTSIDLYGILYKVFEMGDATLALANTVRNLLRNEWAWPRQTTQINLSSGGGVPAVTFGCLGYMARLNYPYNQTTVSGETNLSTILAAILNADPNVLFSATNADITTNTLQVKQYYDDDEEAWSLIKYLSGLGDAAYNRYLFQIGTDRRVTYAAAPTQVEYHQRIQDSLQRITRVAGEEVKPWNVKAGKWLRTTDYLAGLDADQLTYLREDPRVMFIERVSYSAAYGLTLQSGVSDRADQRLGQLGLAGGVM